MTPPGVLILANITHSQCCCHNTEGWSSRNVLLVTYACSVTWKTDISATNTIVAAVDWP